MSSKPNQIDSKQGQESANMKPRHVNEILMIKRQIDITDDVKKVEHNINYYKKVIEDYNKKLDNILQQEFKAKLVLQSNEEKLKEYMEDLSALDKETGIDKQGGNTFTTADLEHKLISLSSEVVSNKAIIENLVKLNT